MSFSLRATSKAYRASVRLVVILIIASLAVTLSPVQADVAGVYARRALRSAFESLGETVNNRTHVRAQGFGAERVDDASQNADRVTQFRLCPRRLTLYVGEAFTLVALPLKSRPVEIRGSDYSKIELTAEFTSPGRNVVKPDTILPGFISHSKTSKYKDPTHLILSADGLRTEFTTTRRKVFVLRDSVIEMLFTEIPHEMFLKISKAKTLNATLGATKLRLLERHLRILREIAKRAVPHSLPNDKTAGGGELNNAERPGIGNQRWEGHR